MPSFTQEELLSGNISLTDLKAKFEELSMQELSEPVKSRVKELRQLQNTHRSFQVELENQIFALERAFHEKFSKLYDNRKTIVSGSEGKYTDELKGIPEFWLTALSNHSLFKEFIQEQDVEALRFLTDIRIVFLAPADSSNRDFAIEFEFSPENPFFKNSILKKTFLYQEDELMAGSYVLDHMEGTVINWHPGKDCTVKKVQKTQRHKTKNITRTVEREEACASFFRFFDPLPEETPAASDADEEDLQEEDANDREMQMEMDYEIADVLRHKIIPNAVDYFLGIVEDEEEDEGDGDYDDACESCDEHHEEDEDDDEEPHHKAKSVVPPKQDCKQQ